MTPSPERVSRDTVDANGSEREDGMAPVKRKQSAKEVDVRCPKCRERVPDGSRQCTMCGHSLADVAAEAAPERAGEPPER